MSTITDKIAFERIEQKRKQVERALKETTDPQLIRELNSLLDMLTIRLCQVA